jgi:hypothetical protein
MEVFSAVSWCRTRCLALELHDVCHEVSQRHVVGGHNAGYFSHMGDIVHPKIDPTAHWTIGQCAVGSIFGCTISPIWLKYPALCPPTTCRCETSFYMSSAGITLGILAIWVILCIRKLILLRIGRLDSRMQTSFSYSLAISLLLMEVFSAVSWCRTRCLALELHDDPGQPDSHLAGQSSMSKWDFVRFKDL